MKRHSLKELLAVCGAVACFALALAMPAAADGVSGVVDAGGNSTTSGAIDSATNANGHLCFGILTPAPCPSSPSGGSSGGSSATPPGVSATVNGDGTVADGNANAAVDASVNANANDSSAPNGAASSNPCAPTSSTQASDSNPLTSDRSLLFSGGVASALAAGAMAIKRMRKASL